MAETDAGSPFDALASALDEVGDRWTLLIVAALLEAPARFGDLQGALPGIAPNVLTQRLRRLQEQGLVTAHPYSRRPPRMSYELTSTGRELAGAVRLLADWAARRAGEETGPQHAVCGTTLEVRWWCPTCGEPVEDPEEGLHRL